MEDFTTTAVARDAGYYQRHFEGLPLVVLAIALISVLYWALRSSQKPG
ncbi:hypothetical protein H6F86_16300 [Phormidium sp. FACHB-592]|uniref:Uncharacterized protein n=1 Tax=Stenomitos frigidus AS-A4 TaxID=2933935 RepID=A0ABV0KQ39_9CYAN|nr:hypothetical protein [Phormidium sp. FACHB-592]MBD2075426.1 hypothetical protein [Phormidium sp. FACHB-592]